MLQFIYNCNMEVAKLWQCEIVYYQWTNREQLSNLLILHLGAVLRTALSPIQTVTSPASKTKGLQFAVSNTIPKFVVVEEDAPNLEQCLTQFDNLPSPAYEDDVA